MINILPFDDRLELVKVKAKVDYDGSNLLKDFVAAQRKKLGEFMGSNIIKLENTNNVDKDMDKVDMRYALGFGKESCIQADFLIPALLGMANAIGDPLVVLPEGGLVNRPILFNSVQTPQLFRNISYFAGLYGLDEGVAGTIETQFKNNVGTKGNSAEYDLKCISFLAKVSRMITKYVF